MNNPITNFRKNFEALKKRLPNDVAILALKHYDLNFKKQGFDGQKWQEVQRRIEGTKANKYAKKPQRTKAILSGKTQLLAKSNYIKQSNWDRIVIANSAKSDKGYNYGLAHNYGTSKLPQRKFLGYSIVLNKKIVNFVGSQLNKVFK